MKKYPQIRPRFFSLMVAIPISAILLMTAAQNSSAQPITTEKIWQLCSDSINAHTFSEDYQPGSFFANNFHGGACFGYIRSLVETSHLLIDAMDQLVKKDPSERMTPIKYGVTTLKNTYCIPPHSSLTDQVLNFMTYVDDHPEERSKRALYSFRRAMKASYPCPSQAQLSE